MDRMTYRYTFPDRFVAGTIGVPGQRTFFIQARDGNRINSVVCEKQQVGGRFGLRPRPAARRRPGLGQRDHAAFGSDDQWW